MQGNIYIVLFANVFFIQCLKTPVLGYPQSGNETVLQLNNFNPIIGGLQLSQDSVPISYITSIYEDGYLVNTGDTLKIVPINPKVTPCIITGGALGSEKYRWKEIVFRWIKTEKGYDLYAAVIHVSTINKTRYSIVFIAIDVIENGEENLKMRCFIENLQNVQDPYTTSKGNAFLFYIWLIPVNEPQSYKVFDPSPIIKQNPYISEATVVLVEMKTRLTISGKQFEYLKNAKGHNSTSLSQGFPQIPSGTAHSQGEGYLGSFTTN